ncbi:MAG TPA: nickel insertion protein, partial [Anaeromyxobacteraceae bacterium]|nr:nickel insertion protein [Anaeromyxobacteraceae bacterium]
WATPCTMKKGRPGLVLAALCPESCRDAVVRALFAESTTLGVRMRPVDRVELERSLEPVETPYGTVRVKVGRLGGEVMGAHPEYEDCAARARERSVAVKEVMTAALVAWRSRAVSP